METLIAPFVNVSILVGILVWNLRKPLAQFVVDRHQRLRTDLSDVKDKMAKAQAEFNEYNSKLKSIDVEIASIREQGMRDIAESKTKIVTEAKRLATTVVSDANLSAQSMNSEFIHKMRKEFSFKVIERAEILIRQRLGSGEQSKLLKDYCTQVEAWR